jgi:hypothetical protein
MFTHLFCYSLYGERFTISIYLVCDVAVSEAGNVCLVRQAEDESPHFNLNLFSYLWLRRFCDLGMTFVGRRRRFNTFFLFFIPIYFWCAGFRESGFRRSL